MLYPFSSLAFEVLTLLPLQIGLFLDFPPWISPILVMVGLMMVLYWYVDDSLLWSLSPSFSARAFVAIPLVTGIILGTVALVQTDAAFWTYLFILLATGSAIKGAVSLRYLRKILSAIQKVMGASSTDEPGASASSSARFFLWERLAKFKYRITSFVFIGLATVIVFIVSVRSIYGWSLTSVVVALAVFVAGSVVWTLMWDLRSVIDPHRQPTMHPYPILGTIVYVAGTEVLNFPGLVLPYLRPIARTILPVPFSVFASVLPSTTNIAVLVVAEAAFLFGFIIALIFWRLSSL